ncbi:calcium-binding protein, partial [Actibacterium sp.]|uniref:calcium-binding protein n=1 Tax=Actibacterium sp. TaxID=1872125 RepID=UPI0035634909
MTTYVVGIYDVDPSTVISTTAGDSFTWSSSTQRDGTATINDTNTYSTGTFDREGGRYPTTATVTVNGTTSTNAQVTGTNSWTLYDAVTGETFEVVEFNVWSGGATGSYTLSEQPLVEGRTYQVMDYASNPEATAGDPVFTYANYTDLNDVVEGTGGDDVIDASYANDPEGDAVDDGIGTGALGMGDVIDGAAGNDQISAGDGDDIIYGGAGQDQIDGGAGDDVIYGDGPDASATSEYLHWMSQGLDGQDMTSGFTQSTGTMNVNVSFTQGGNGDAVELYDGTQYVESGETFDTNSGLYLDSAGGGGQTTVARIEFEAPAGSGLSNEVENVEFRIQDLDMGGWVDQVTISAYDADGNVIDPATFTIITDGTDTVSNGVMTGVGKNDSVSSKEGSVYVQIPGPVSVVLIDYDNLDTAHQLIVVSDVHFDTIPITGDDDVIDGGTGNDT